MAKKFIVSSLVALCCLFLVLSSSMAELDKTRKLKAAAEYYFDKGEYYKAIDIWAEVLKIDSYDKEALEGLSMAQRALEETHGEKEKAERERLRKLVEEGKRHYKDKEYKKALSSWGEALSIDPTNKEILDLIEDARIRAEYQISILDKLDREKRLKTPHIEELDKIANEMIRLLEKADVIIREKKAEEIKERIEVEKEESKAETGGDDFIREIFTDGERLYREGRFEEAISEWNKILPFLPESSKITVKIEELKEKIKAEEERKRLEEDLKAAEEYKKKERKETLAKEPEIKETLAKEPEIKENVINDNIIIGIAIALILFLILKIAVRSGVKPYSAKAPPKKAKEEGFEPRGLKKFLNKKIENRDKDLFK